MLRHLLSADSREERLLWCNILNKALDNLRAWDTVNSRSVLNTNDEEKIIFNIYLSGPALSPAVTRSRQTLSTPARPQPRSGREDVEITLEVDFELIYIIL